MKKKNGRWLLSYIVNVLTLIILNWLLPNVSLGFPTGAAFTWESFWLGLPVVLIAALILTLLLKLVKPILKLILLPINFLTLGLVSAILDFGILWLTTYLVPSFTITSLQIGGFNLGYWGGLVVVTFVFALIQSLLMTILK